MLPASKEDLRYVRCAVLPQSLMGLTASGLFYGWGALGYAIDMTFCPDDPHVFRNQHGTFTGVIILVLSVLPAFPLRVLLDKKIVSEFSTHLTGILLTLVGLVLGGISLQYRILWLLYIGCAVPCGIGAICIFQRIIFNHQLWVKRVGYMNLGSGFFGFTIGFWTAIFFLVSVPLLQHLEIQNVLHVYTAFVIPCSLWSLFSIDDNSIAKSDERREEQRIAASNKEEKGVDAVAVAVEGCQGEEVLLTYREICAMPQTYQLFFFFAAVLTPGWGIKLSFISILRVLFNASPAYSASMTSLYVSVYAVGRLCSGVAADFLGVTRTFDVMMVSMVAVLLAIPSVVASFPLYENSPGCVLFIVLVCVLGMHYGGSKALFYSIVFEVFGAKNYRNAFSLCFTGFALSVFVGGMSSAYSFSTATAVDDAQLQAAVVATSQMWFYSMAGGMVFALMLLHSIKPVDYQNVLRRRARDAANPVVLDRIVVELQHRGQ